MIGSVLGVGTKESQSTTARTAQYLERCSSMRWRSCVLLDCEVLREERLSEWVMFSMLPTTGGEGRLAAADNTHSLTHPCPKS